MLTEYFCTQPCQYSTLLDPSLVGNYPEWDEGHAGADEAAGDEDTCYEEQGEMDFVYDEWNESAAGTTGPAREEEQFPFCSCILLVIKTIALHGYYCNKDVQFLSYCSAVLTLVRLTIRRSGVLPGRRIVIRLVKCDYPTG